MKKALVLVMVLGVTELAWSEKALDRLQSAGEVLHEIMNAPDKGIPEEVIERAKCIAVIPHEIKGGFTFGGAYGKGVATCRTPHKWSAPAFFTITGGTWRAQIGLEGVDNVLMIMSEKGMNHLLSNKFRVGAEASAAAGPSGPARLSRDGLEVVNRDSQLLPRKGGFCGRDARWFCDRT
jgi:lipid-binding SYLF domain-containing protein